MKLTHFVAVSCYLTSTLLVGAALSDTQANGDAFIAPLASKSLLLDIDKDSSKLVAVGERGHILVSQDGKSWAQKTVPTQSLLTSVYINGNTVWAVGHDAIILGSKDGGESWSVKQFLPKLQRPLLDIHFKDDSNGIAVGSYGVFFRTTDGGETWAREYHTSFLHPDDKDYVESLKDEDPEFYREEMSSILPHLNRISYHDGRLLLAGEAGLVSYSDDYGQTWKRIDMGYYGSFFDIKTLENGNILAAGLRGSVYQSSKDMEEWKRIDSKTTSTFNSILPINESTALLLGNNGTTLRLHDGEVDLGKTKDGKALVSAVLFNSNVIAVSEVGVKTLNSGRQSQ
ncbi:YCF48-related protein [Alteromonas sp. a30]|uniref:YCF48-related protein n=1 Tax=Alteromonas sp. a30 TaxID=2730917 RepID=UPI002281E938|nr:YCF48-related protein [Alteromonas sp. a30]MCY7293905.1 hypothetical protein [Alteromonas sp. a30]